MEYHEGQLKITGTQNSKELENIEYLHHGISNRQFIRTFSLADYVEVREAVMQDGILTVRLQREIPEAQKPKQIAITYAN